jgi:prepilin-type N-terminal cleavage/methylation domain-containing protein
MRGSIRERNSGEAAVAVRRRAFTLVELLVVVGIVAVLIALLMPVLASARRQANTAACLNNLRQLGMGYHRYVAENKGWAPRGGGMEFLVLGRLLQPGVDRPDPIPLCPEATEVGGWQRLGWTSTAQMIIGTARTAWGCESSGGAADDVPWPWPAGCSYGITTGSGVHLTRASPLHSGKTAEISESEP